ELRTWVELGARLSAQGGVEAIPRLEWQKMREELQAISEGRIAEDRPWQVWAERGEGYAKLGQWEKAAATYSEAVELGADDDRAWYHEALAYLAIHDTARYRESCASLLRNFGKADTPD